MANAVLKTMDFEESAALEAITYTCTCYPVFLSKLHTYYFYMLNYTCIFTLHVCDRMTAESIQAALGMKTTQLNLNLA
jgi:hypothetical protein